MSNILNLSAQFSLSPTSLLLEGGEMQDVAEAEGEEEAAALSCFH